MEEIKTVDNQKNFLLQIIIDSLNSRLEHCEDDDSSALSAKTLNTDRWTIAKEEIDVLDGDVEKAFQMRFTKESRTIFPMRTTRAMAHGFAIHKHLPFTYKIRS